LHAGLVYVEPSSYAQAASIPEWRVAMDSEFQSLLQNDTWSLCSRPPGKNLVPCKWVFKLKRRPDDSVERHKAGLVAVGYLQRSGVDFLDTFSPIIKPSTIRMVLTIAVSFNWDIRQLDVSNAFLYGVLEEEVYMTQPKGFVDPSLFVCHRGNVHAFFLVYVDDILVTSNDQDFITTLIS